MRDLEYYSKKVDELVAERDKLQEDNRSLLAENRKQRDEIADYKELLTLARDFIDEIPYSDSPWALLADMNFLLRKKETADE